MDGNMKYNFESFKQKLGQLNLSMTESMEEQFSDFYELLIEWNQKMNLTAITDFDEAADKHFLDSAALGHFIQLKAGDSLIDIGTGAGFPGIPIKILFPKLRIVLADSLNKRVRFLEEVIYKLKLDGISAIHTRAEELARNKEHREQYDICVSRAVANLSSLSEYCIPFVKKGGKFISYKSCGIEEEIQNSKKAIHLMGGKLSDVIEFQLPGTEYMRSFIIIDKEHTTPNKFPRKPGIPAKEPLY